MPLSRSALKAKSIVVSNPFLSYKERHSKSSLTRLTVGRRARVNLGRLDERHRLQTAINRLADLR